MERLIDAVAPPRLGSRFRWLIGSSWVSNLGDGIAVAAGPLFVASETDSPFLVSLAALCNWLPALLFGLFAGAVADRFDRRRIVIVVNLARVAVLVVLTAMIASGTVSIAAVLATMLVLGTAETFADTASSTLMPMIVERDDLPIANARQMTGFITLNNLAGPPIGALLFAGGRVLPPLTQALLVVAATLLVARVATSLAAERSTAAAEQPTLRSQVAEGFRWVIGHPPVRTLTLTILTFNVTFGAAWSVLVLYATRRLGLSEAGFGLITTMQAIGGLIGTTAYGWITRRVSLGNLMRIGLLIETATHLALAALTHPVPAMAVFVVFGAHAFIWGTTSMTIRQRAVPLALQGRVNSVNRVASFGGLTVGAALGGLIAERWGVTAPFWFAGVGSAVFVVAIWRQLTNIAHHDANPVATELLR